jgi:hypothetical protein
MRSDVMGTAERSGEIILEAGQKMHQKGKALGLCSPTRSMSYPIRAKGSWARAQEAKRTRIKLNTFISNQNHKAILIA